MTSSNFISPVVKWAGGKRQLLSEILPLLPEHFTTYCEPFLGGGAVLFSLQPYAAIVNDINPDLITAYEVIRDNVDLLVESLKMHVNTPEYFYSIRSLDRNKTEYQALSKIEQASRLLFLNKTCFNGLFRVNSSGEFNSPYGYYRNPNFINEPVLRAVSNYFNTNNIEFYCEDFSETLQRIKKDGFVYLDPPYDPVSDTSDFTSYNKGGFNKNDQIRLKQCCDKLSQHNIKFLLSNSATEFI
ncbi:MAG: DNA adenine methylase, partial [Oscillospiraceae bacterium]|nr:DNA adenine methylase [Oscillospiraceae bacterium]